MFGRMLADGADGADGRSASVRCYPSGAPPVAAAACALYLTVLSLYGERPCSAHAAINSCRGLGDSTEPHPRVTPPYAFGSTTTPAPHTGHSAFGERTTSGTSHSRRHSVRIRTGGTLRLAGHAHREPLGERSAGVGGVRDPSRLGAVVPGSSGGLLRVNARSTGDENHAQTARSGAAIATRSGIDTQECECPVTASCNRDRPRPVPPAR
jgi:hypothetical protein